MSRFAPVAPCEMLWRLKSIGDFVLGRYHLLLAHDVAEHAAGFEDLLEKDSIIIMDNSLIELGAPVTDGKIIEQAIKAVPSTYIVLPDVEGDSEQTYDLSMRCAKDWRRFNTSFMAVIQGTEYEEYVDTAERLREIPGVSMWGVPRSSVPYLRSRRRLVEYLNRQNFYSHRGGIHLLGFSNDIQDDVMCAKMQGVAGIDSAVPLRMGQKKIMIDDPRATELVGPRGNFWTNWGDDIEPETLANLYLFRGWINAGI